MKAWCVTLAAGLLLAGPAGAETICGRELTSIDELREQLVNKERLEIVQDDGLFLAVSDPARMQVWSFASGSHPAYPSVACRSVVTEGDKVVLRTELQCAADQKACDQLAVDYKELDERVSEEQRKIIAGKNQESAQ